MFSFQRSIEATLRTLRRQMMAQSVDRRVSTDRERGPEAETRVWLHMCTIFLR